MSTSAWPLSCPTRPGRALSYKFLMNTDLFNIWYIGVLCIGIAVVAGLKG